MSPPSNRGSSDSDGDSPKRNIGSGLGRAAASARLRAVRIALSHDLIRAGRVLDRRGMIVATEGNLSARISAERLLITRSGSRKGELSTRDFVEIEVTEAKPDAPARPVVSSEHRVHRAGYALRPDAESILHAHPVALTAFALRGKIPDFNRFDEGRLLIGSAGFVSYHPSGTQALADAVGNALLDPERPKLLLLGDHGALALGKTVDDALCRLEIAERLAATLLAAEGR